jgi:hypothetical protein
MRMWMCDPKILCTKHLLGEHVEMHMFLGHLQKKRGITGYLKNNCLEPRSIYQRHEDLAAELIRRGFNHKSPMNETDFNIVCDLPIECQYWEVNKEENLKNLTGRCEKCNDRFISLSISV